MKTLCYIAFFAALLISTKPAGAQNIARQPGCSDTFILHQADSIKEAFSREGFIVVKEASMTMESEYEMPVIVPLIQSTQYQFVFIGDRSSDSYEVKMFDWDEKQVAGQKKQAAEDGANVISYAYTPKFSEYHMIKPVQVNKEKKNLCGYVMLLKKVK